MRAVVLVGGFGTRLRPLTWHTPKQMLPVVDRTMLERVLAGLAHHGVDDVVLSMGFRPTAFTDTFPDGVCAGVSLHYAVEPEPLDTAGAVRFAAMDAGIDDTFLVVNGDVLTDLDITALIAQHRSTGAEGTIALTPVDDPSRYGVVPIDGDHRVQAFIEKPPRDEAPSHWINAGTYVLEPSVLGRIEPARKVSIERVTFPAMVTDGTLYALQEECYWVDAGTPATYLQCQLDLIDGTRATERSVEPTARVAPDAVVGHSVIMAGAVIEPGAQVRGSVILPGAQVLTGARVLGSIIGPGSVVSEGAELGGLSVIGDNVVVPSGAQLASARLPEVEPDPHTDPPQ